MDKKPSQEEIKFAIARDRDAWAVIRGYVYQVDLTILRWLELLPDQTLELERGEDIDLISQSLTSEKSERLLEQVKHRAQQISLRSSPALSALACALEHRTANPELNLLFRYTTNARIAIERVSLIKKSVPGIVIWEELRAGRISGNVEIDHLEHLRLILKEAERPTDLNNETWQKFLSFVNQTPDAGLLQFVRSFEWSTGESDPEQLESRIKSLLVSRGSARDEKQASEQYQRLFLYVFKLLGIRDIKRLTPQALAQQLALPALNDSDRQLLMILTTGVRDLEERVSKLERNFAGTNAAMILQAAVAATLTKATLKEAIEISPSLPILDPPPTVTELTRREHTVNDLLKKLQNCAWLALHGAAGVGKTQLALLLSKQNGKCRAWLRFRDLDHAQSCARLIKAFELLTGHIFRSGQKQWFAQICASLGSGSLIVLDDLPRLTGSEDLTDLLTSLAFACRDSGVQLISTSHWITPSRVSEALGSLVLNIQSPRLDDTEAKEILFAYGAPLEKANDKFVHYLNSLTSRHPALFSAAARFLAQRKWRFTEEALTLLMKGQYTEEVVAETVERLLQTVEDDDSRELLYRLKLLWGNFSQPDVDLLANVKPVIRSPNEKLHGLTGLWIQKETATKFSVSPLVRTLGEGFLTERTRYDCHDVLGRRLFTKKKVDPHGLWEAFGHFWSAKEFGRASAVILIALTALQRLKDLPDDFGFLDVWIESPLPKEFDLGTQIYLRTVQIAVRARFNKPNDYPLRDLDKLIAESSSTQGWAVLAAAVSLNAVLAKRDPERANGYLVRALTLNPELIGPTGEKLTFPEALGPEFLFWTTTCAIRTPEDLRKWLSNIEQLTDRQREEVFISKYGDEGCLELAERLWLEEMKTPTQSQRWDLILDALNGLAEWGAKFKIGVLVTCAIRTKITVLAEHLEKLDSAVALAESFLSSPGLDANARFLIMDALGRQYRYARKNDECLNLLNAALSERTEGFELERVSALLNASCAIGDKDEKKAIEYATSALTLARSVPMADRLVVIAAGELAIAAVASKWQFSVRIQTMGRGDREASID